MNFIAGLVLGKVDDRIHSVMTRYSRGTFEGPAAEASVSGKKLKISGSYLYVPILGELTADLCDDNLFIQGTVVSKADLGEDLEIRGLEILDVKKRGGFKYRVSGTLSPNQFGSLYEDLWDAAVLTKARARGFVLSTGSNVPKPNKINEPNFCRLTFPSTQENQLTSFEAIAPGAEPRDFETLKVNHVIRVDELILPEGLDCESASVVRLRARRKGVLSRHLLVDGEETKSDFEFLA